MKTKCNSMCQVPALLCSMLWLVTQIHPASASVQVHKFMGAIAKHNTDFQDDPSEGDKKKENPHSEKETQSVFEDGHEMITKATSAVKFPEKSSVPEAVQGLIAMVWVFLLGSVPIIIYKLDDSTKITRTGIVLSVSMWVGLFGGLYLFTTTILFQSSHFEQIRSLTIIECVYFMTQVITTVGYGDITPAHHRGQAFVGMYVVVSFFVIALLLSEMQTVVMARVEKYKTMLETKISRGQQSNSTLAFKPDRPSAASLIMSAIAFALIAFIWMCFFALYPGEKKTWGEAMYMSFITLSTVGFGAVTPDTEGGMLFAAFFMFFGSSALVGFVTNFSTFSMQMGEWEAWNPDAFQKDLMKLRNAEGGGKTISELDFVSFTLIHKNIVSQDQLNAIKEAYIEMKKTPRGSIRKSLSVKVLAQSSGIENAHLDMSDSEEEAIKASTPVKK